MTSATYKILKTLITNGSKTKNEILEETQLSDESLRGRLAELKKAGRIKVARNITPYRYSITEFGSNFLKFMQNGFDENTEKPIFETSYKKKINIKNLQSITLYTKGGQKNMTVPAANYSMWVGLTKKNDSLVETEFILRRKT